MSDTKLLYTVIPSSVYCTRDSRNPSLVTLSIGASNTTDEDITIVGFQIALPVSNDINKADALTSDPSSIVPVSLQPLTWDFQQRDDGVYRAEPVEAGTVIPAGQSLTFQLQTVTVNEAVGTAVMKITENSGSDVVTIDRPVIKTRSKMSISFRVVPDRVTSGGASTLSWETSGAARVTLSPGNFPNIKPNDSVNVNVGTTTMFTLTAFGEGPNISEQRSVFVESPEIVDFKSSAKIVNANDKVILSWEVKYADKISIAPGDHQDLPAKGTLEVPVTTETTFILTASNKGNQYSNKAAPVGINPVTISSFTASPAYGARVGDPITLSWNVASAVTASVQYGTLTRVDPAKLNTGTLTIIPNTGIAYSLTAANSLGSAMKSIELLPMPLGWYKFTGNAPFRFPEPPLVLKFKNDIWAMASNLMNAIYYSFDGVNWIPATNKTPWQTRSYAGGVVFKDKMWLMGGRSTSGNACLNDVWSSADGINWTCETNAASWPARRSFGCFVLPGVNKLFIVGGLDNSGNCLNDVWSSADGKQWVKEKDQAFQTGRAAFGTAVYNGAVWTLAGLINGDEQKGTPTNEVWYSSDGKQWNKTTDGPNWQARSYPAVAALSMGLYVSGGIDETKKGIADVNRMNASGSWSMMPGPAWQDIKVTSGLEYQDSLWCVGGGLQSNRPNAAVWAYSPALNS